MGNESQAKSTGLSPDQFYLNQDGKLLIRSKEIVRALAARKSMLEEPGPTLLNVRIHVSS